jgi:hypothetical protein
MRKDSVHVEVIDALAVSASREANAAIQLLRDGARIEVHETGVPCLDLLRIYEARLSHVQSKPGAHADRLTEATSEFVSNLEYHRSKIGCWITIKGSQEMHIALFRTEDGQFLACLPVVSQLDVSSERWVELWSSNA